MVDDGGAYEASAPFPCPDGLTPDDQEDCDGGIVEACDPTSPSPVPCQNGLGCVPQDCHGVIGKALAWAAATGVSIALYTVIDAQGVRAAPSAENPSIRARLDILSRPDLRIALTTACAAPDVTIITEARSAERIGGAWNRAYGFATVTLERSGWCGGSSVSSSR